MQEQKAWYWYYLRRGAVGVGPSCRVPRAPGVAAVPAGVVVGFVLVSVAFAALGALLGVVLPTARSAQGLGVLLFFVFMMLGGAGPPWCCAARGSTSAGTPTRWR